MKKLTSEKYLLKERGFLYVFWPMVEEVELHTHEYYEFFFIKNGSAMHTVNGSLQILPPNSISLIRPSDCHRYKKLGTEPFSLYNAMITKEIIHALAAHLGDSVTRELLDTPLPPVVQLSQEEMGSLIRNINYLMTLPPDREEAKTVNNVILSFVLYKLLLADSTTRYSQLPKWLNQLTREMQEKENFVEGLPAMLRLSDKSHEFICRSFQKYLHCSPSEYINQLRKKHSEFLLLNTGDSVMDVAMSCGFNSISHFNHVFRKMMCCSPTKYREDHKIVVGDTYTDPRVMPERSTDLLR